MAETTYLPDKFLNLITVAQAAHWFNLDAFYKEFNRFLKVKGILAMWCYGFFKYLQNKKNSNQLYKSFMKVLILIGHQKDN
ncbi:MAG: hypothetical protein AB4063_10105 [Crocosphaera sp.]